MDTGKVVVRKSSIWLAFIFYILIGFEFFYMISPFAVYFYSVYQPGLEILNGSQTFSWLGATFLPHIVNESDSLILNNLTTVGFLLTFGGAALFCYGAVLVYWSKLTKKQLVSGYIYNFVRHPQYSALIICGLGMLLLWPRYIVLISYVSMLFIYYFLAKHEEQECLFKFGESYHQYMKFTPMFFPVRIKWFTIISSILPRTTLSRVFTIAGLYLLVVIFSVQMADFVRSWSLDKLYALYDDDSATIAVVKFERSEITRIVDLSMKDSRVQKRLAAFPETTKFINYIVPLNWSASEIPMHQQEEFDHFNYSRQGDMAQVKLVVTSSVADTGSDVTGKQIILHSKDRLPVVETIVNLKNNSIEQVIEPVGFDALANIPLPVF